MSSASSRLQPAPALDPLRTLVTSCGLPCGPLSVLAPNSKRVVISDQANVVIRAQRFDDPALREPETEIAWAMRFNAVTHTQIPFWFRPVTTEDGWLLTLWQYLPGSSVTSAEDAAAHGRAIRMLHDKVPLTGRDRQSADPTDQLRVAAHRVTDLVAAGHPHARLLEAAVQQAFDYLTQAYASSDLVASHGDVNPNTALAMTGGIALMDFDSACVAPRLLDIASGVYTYRRYFDETMGGAFLDGYGPHPALTEAALAAHMWIRHLRITVARAAAGKPVEEDLARLEAAAGTIR